MSIKNKLNDFKAKLKFKWRQFKSWVSNNKETVINVGIVATPVLIKAGKSVYKSHHKTARQKWEEAERERIDTTYYDPKTGLHWQLKRKPTNAERAIIERRRKNNEDTYEILLSLDLV